MGYLAVEAGYNVRFTTAQEFADSLYTSLAYGNFKRELERYGKFDLLIIDELGFLSLDKTASNHFFQVINQAYERQASDCHEQQAVSGVGRRLPRLGDRHRDPRPPAASRSPLST